MKLSVFALFSAPLLVTAQYGYGDASSAPASSAASSPSSAAAAPLPSAGPGQHIVQVGAGGDFVFKPNTINASANEIITFVFTQPAGVQHSVTQSSFANPCTPLQNGFDSGLQVTGMEWNLTITDTSKPIWVYCKQTTPLKHCGMGMVAGINVPAGSPNTVDAFVNAAKAIGNNEGPQTVSGGLSGVGAMATAPASSVAPPAPSKSSAAEQLAVNAGSLVTAVFAFFALA